MDYLCLLILPPKKNMKHSIKSPSVVIFIFMDRLSITSGQFTKANSEVSGEPDKQISLL